MASTFTRKPRFLSLLFLFWLTACHQGDDRSGHAAVVLQTDFGLKDGAVSSMKGVIRGVDPGIDVYDLTHEIPAYDTWEAAYRLSQTVAYWPRGTVFVSVVDPGVGTGRKSVILLTRSGHYVVSPDNGTLGLVAEQLGIRAVREIDEAVNRRAASKGSYTFHGRDVYAYTAARLASGKISFEEVGKPLPDTVMSIPYPRPVLVGDSVFGMIPVLDIRYGNIWTNIPDTLLEKHGLRYGDTAAVRIYSGPVTFFRGRVPLVHTFGEVPVGSFMAYYNSLMQFSVAVNQGSMADSLGVKSGPGWHVSVGIRQVK
jgi:S-adenosylmethionine hydrolase